MLKVTSDISMSLDGFITDTKASVGTPLEGNDPGRRSRLEVRRQDRRRCQDLGRREHHQAVSERGAPRGVEIHLVPILLSRGVRLFEDLTSESFELRRTRCIETPGATHF